MSLASRFDLLGSSGVLQGFEYIEYPPFEDAPQEGDYNLLASIGKAIAAVAIVAVAAFVIGATGGLALALVGGAAVFAGCVVYSDYQNGNVSDFGTYLAAAISGAVVGAISYMFFAQAALAIKTIAGGTQFIGLVGAQLGIPFLMTNAKLLATIAGYGLAGFFGLQGVNYFSSAVSGSENALVGIFFEEGTPEYYQALDVYNGVALLGNMLGMGYLQEAVRHMPPIAPSPISSGNKQPEKTLYRGERSSSTPEKVFNEGFESKGTHNDLEKHLKSNTTAGDFVSSSSEYDIAEGFTNKNGYLYEIETSNYIDVNNTLGEAAPYSEQREFAIPGGIPPESIKGAYPYSNGAPVGEYIPNPNFKGGN